MTKFKSINIKTLFLNLVVLTAISVIGWGAGRMLFHYYVASKIQTLEISDEDKSILANYAFNVLDSKFDDNTDEFDLSILPKFDSYEKLFISIIHDNALRCSKGYGLDTYEGNRVEYDIFNSVVACVDDERFGGVLEDPERVDSKIVFNYLYNKRQVENNLDALSRNIELGIHAIELRKGKISVFFKESVPISKNYEFEQTLNRLCLKGGLDFSCYLDSEVEIHIYDALTFVADRDGSIQDLYRYNTLLSVDDISQDLITERLNLLHGWYVNNVSTSSGLLEYEYFPSLDSYNRIENNHVRQMASIWAMADQSIYLENDELTTTINNTLDYYLNFKQCNGNDCYIELDGYSKLAYNAFLSLGLVNSPDYPDSKLLLEQLLNGILSLQNDDGSYNTYFNSDRSTGAEYYPGEAMLALMVAYEHTEDEKYLDSVIRGYHYYKDHWRNFKSTAFVAWHTQTYYLLHKYYKDDELIPFIFELNDWVIEHSYIENSLYPDLNGAMNKDAPSCVNTATYLEGILDAYDLAKQTHDKDREERYLEVIKNGIKFLLSAQYTEENSFYIPNPDIAIGGVRERLTDNSQRIDYNQHTYFVLKKALNYIDF